MRTCRHGVPYRTIHVWNDACPKCCAIAETYEDQSRAEGGRLTHRYRQGEFDRLQARHLRGFRDPLRGGLRAMTGTEEFEASEAWKERRATGIERRAEVVEERLTRPVDLPGWLADLLEECRAEFTDRQVEALVYRYGYDLSLQEAADALGLRTKWTFRKRLAGAEAKVRHLRGDVLGELEDEERLDEVLAHAENPEREGARDIEGDENYLVPLVQRQRRWERAVDRFWGLAPRSA